jgi:hypothetical protein
LVRWRRAPIADLLRQMIGFAVHRLMELSLTVAAPGEAQRWRI